MGLKNGKIYRWLSALGAGMGLAPGRFEEFFKFAVVGGSGVIVNMGLFYVFTRIAGIDIKFASPIAIEISILSNFFLNNMWTFRKRDTYVPLHSRIFRYHLVTGLAGIVNYFTLLLLANLAGIQDLIANLIGIALGMLINYFLNSLWTWRIRAGEEPEHHEL